MRWKNFQAFIARLTILGLIDCSTVSALSYILPSSPTYPDLQDRKVGGPQRIASDLIAASQWLSPDQALQWVYEQCKKAEANDGSRKMWTMDRWHQWRDQLSFFAGQESFSKETRSLAQALCEKMAALEHAGGQRVLA